MPLGAEQPQWVSWASENRRGRNRRQRKIPAVSATMPKATGCCQSTRKTSPPHFGSQRPLFLTLTGRPPGGCSRRMRMLSLNDSKEARDGHGFHGFTRILEKAGGFGSFGPMLSQSVARGVNLWLGILLGAALAGCGTKPGSASPPRVLAHPVPAGQIRPLDSGNGTIRSVNTRLRFVVLDFALSIVPQPGQRLEVIRDGQTVGELKVTGPAQGAATAADLIAGEPIAGDTVRPK